MFWFFRIFVYDTSIADLSGEHRRRVVPLDEHGIPALRAEEVGDRGVGTTSHDGGCGDLRVVQMQDRQHRAVAAGVEECRRRHDAASGPVSASPSPITQATMRSGLSNAAPAAWIRGIAEFAAFVNAAGRLDTDVAGNPTGRRRTGDTVW